MTRRRMSFMRRAAVVGMLGTALQFGGCKFDEFEATFTVQSRDMVELLVRSWLLTPLEEAIDAGIDRLFDKLEG